MKYRIEYGYDRHVRSWCIIVFDSKNNDVEAEYIGSLDQCLYVIDELKEKYNTKVVDKIKAY